MSRDQRSETSGMPTSDTLRQWRERRKSIMEQEKALRRERSALDKLIEAGEQLVGVETRNEPPKQDDAISTQPSSQGSKPKPHTKSTYTRHEKSWPDTIKDIVTAQPRGMTVSDIKLETAKTHLGERLKETDAAFYGAISKLEKRGKLIRYKGYFFTPEAYAQFQSDVEKGVTKDIKTAAKSAHKSPAKDVVIKFLKGRPNGAEPYEIIDALLASPTTRDAVEKNRNSIYNLLSRMAKRDELVRDGSAYRLPSKKNEAPAEQSEDASEVTGEVTASPNESFRGLFHRG